MSDYGDLIVKVSNPEAFDETIRQLPMCEAAMARNSDGLVKIGEGYLVRCIRGLGFLKFAITNQGYGEILE